MLDLSRFSDIFAQMAPGFGTGSLFGNSQAQPKGPEAPKSPEAPVQPEVPGIPKDILDLSQIASNHPFASYDRIGASPPPSEPPPIAVAENGTYQPTKIQHRFSSSLSFSFNMSLQQASVIQRPSDSGGYVSRARESAQFDYQAQAASSRQQLGSSYSELRQFEASMFFSRTRSFSQTLSPQTGERVESTGRSVARRFEIEISLDVSFLKQYNVQTESLAGDEPLLNQYLDDVDGLVGRSGEALQAFFDEVDTILADTEAYVQDTLGSFLSDVQTAFGLNEAETDDFVAMIADEVGAFFDEVGSFLDEARSALDGPSAPPELEADEAELALV